MKKIKSLLKIAAATTIILGLCTSFSSTSVEAARRKFLYSFSVISDTHIGNEDNNGLKNLSIALNSIKNCFPNDKCIVINGDVVDNYNDASYNWLNMCIDKVNNNEFDATYNSACINLSNHKLPYIYFNLGNHETRKTAKWGSNPDYYPWSLSQFTCRTREIQVKLSPASDVTYTPRDQSSPYIEQTVCNNKFIFIGSDKVDDQDDCAYIGNDQLRSLSDSISGSDDNLTFLFCHQPPLGDRDNPGIYQVNSANCINSSDAFKNIVGQKKKLIMFTSHEHNKFAAYDFSEGKNFAQFGTVPVFSTSSVKEGGEVNENGCDGCHVTVYSDRVLVQGINYIKGNDYKEVCRKIIDLE